MAAQVEVQKSTARKELDRLHRNIVVDLDRRLVHPTRLEEGSEEPELTEAVQIVERTARALQALRESAARQDKALSESTRRVEALETELQSAAAEREELTRRIENDVRRAADHAAEKEALEAKLEGLEVECEQLSAQLKGLTQLIKASFNSVPSFAQN